MFLEVSEEVIEMAQEIIEQYHPHLENAKVGFIFKDKAGKSGGRVVLGQASKVSEKQQAAGLDLDFLIWLAKDYWDTMTSHKRMALIDHELCHCEYDEIDGASIRGHDVEEFGDIIDRYGLWRNDLIAIAPRFLAATQANLPGMPERGRVVAVQGNLVE